MLELMIANILDLDFMVGLRWVLGQLQKVYEANVQTNKKKTSYLIMGSVNEPLLNFRFSHLLFSILTSECT